ncbi:glycoside hydrolase family 125 protein [Halobacillus shinanisalinarum]|uniref:Glycoside hydrolase family 125 protein n=1 Tax=Halobacillus shinanisalinarum TaxID=2932258 RepID=A0ABY4GVB6_9BACI|nr:glycoside hydrolase family 125 protein [Halobacillus shinanisalinarum]UOQ91896.1 glycoside hydrolase family 125 protein [Halobacillus shinanisalinarum]
MEKTIPESMIRLINEVKDRFANDEKLGEMFEKGFMNTLKTTVERKDDGTTFVITGDIPAMWLRDSAAQVRPYLILAVHDKEVADIVEGVVKRQFQYIVHDPYANAFNKEENGNGHHADNTEMTPLIWERKYEVDSLCYPIQLAYLFWKATGRVSHFNQTFINAAKKIIQTWKIEQEHEKRSSYRFHRENAPNASDTLTRNGKGSLTAKTGMTWSGFRPSDDACKYGYLIPSNMFAVVVLRYLSEIAESVLDDREMKDKSDLLATEINAGIEAHGKVEHPEFGTIYAYETDGFGNHNLIDDANVPSLLSVPYLGYCKTDDLVYQNTRRFILSRENPYYYEGKVARGIGSPHTPERFIWHIALAIQGLTTNDQVESKEILELLKSTDANTYLMHEGFDVDDPSNFTRPWFSWANSMFSEFLLSTCGYYVPGSPGFAESGK